MGKTVDDIVVGANGSIMLAPIDADLPTDIDEAWPAGWVDLGFASEDGAKFTDAKTLAEISVWQMFYVARRIVTARDLLVEFVLRQFNGANFQFATGGGTVEATTNGFKYVPPAPEHIATNALGLEWLDGDKKYRLILPRGMVTENVTVEVARTKATDLPITFGIIGEDSVDPWQLLTNDDTFADEVGS